MTKGLLVTIIGAVCGGLAAYALAPWNNDTRDSAAAFVTGASRESRASLPSDASAENRFASLVQALENRTAENAAGALREASLLPGAARRAAIRRVGEAWARRDPAAAFAQAGTVPPDLRFDYAAAVAAVWARVHLDGYLRALEATPHSLALGQAAAIAAAVDADALWASAQRIDSPNATAFKQRALDEIARRDVSTALALAGALPPGKERDDVLIGFAATYATSDPDAALAWLAQLSETPILLRRAVLTGVANGDPVRAFVLASSPEFFGAAETETTIIRQALRLPNGGAALGDALLAREETRQRTGALLRLMRTWVERDADRALAWLVAHSAELDSMIVGEAANAFASRDAAAAASYTSRVPNEFREIWIAQVAGPYARADAAAAERWLSQLPGEAGYGAALRQAITEVARTDTRAAARMAGAAPDDVQIAVANAVTMRLAADDPSGALQWAAGLTAPEARESGVVTAVRVASSRSTLATAQRAALDLPRGDLRDAALHEVVFLTSTSGGTLDRRLLDAFFSADARDRALANAAPRFAQHDAAYARRLVAEYVRDPELRAEIESRIVTAAP